MSESVPAKGFRLSSVPLLQPLFVRNFAWLWLGGILSMVGGQLTMIAFPWLVIQISGDALAMGAVMALSGIPRAVFMLLGGVFTDRFSPRTVMLWVNWLRMILMFVFAFLVYSQLVEMWMVYLLALMFGVIDAFFWPASSAILPRVLKPELLPAGNALMQGMGQLSLMAGPVIAGFIIAIFAINSGVAGADLPGIAVVFFVDGIGFAIAIVSLMMIKLAPPVTEDTSAFTLASITRSIREGFHVMWNDFTVRMIVIVFTIFSLFFRGPYIVGIPLLCNDRFPEGALAFGMISSAFGVGSLIGLAIAGTLPRPGVRWFGYLMIADVFVIALAMIVYSWTPNVEYAMVASVVSGIMDGYVVIILVSWLQTNIPEHLMGRIMSLIMFFMQGVTPISAAVAGALFRVSLEGVFLGSGLILVAFVMISLMFSSVRNMEESGKRVVV